FDQRVVLGRDDEVDRALAGGNGDHSRQRLVVDAVVRAAADVVRDGQRGRGAAGSRDDQRALVEPRFLRVGGVVGERDDGRAGRRRGRAGVVVGDRAGRGAGGADVVIRACDQVNG